MKVIQNQDFRSSKLISTLGLLLFSTLIVTAPINRHLKDSRFETATRQAEVVGYQVAQIYREATRIEGDVSQGLNRNIASEVSGEIENLRRIGTMGSDPWGQPFHYKILSADRFSGVKVLVWSAGPNMKVDTSDLTNEESETMRHPQYLGDDMGVIVTVAQK